MNREDANKANIHHFVEKALNQGIYAVVVDLGRAL